MGDKLKYIAFLRGINVGKIRIKMADLKKAFETMGFSEVTTFLQTGNVTFFSSEPVDVIKSILEKGLSQTFQYEAYVLIYPYPVLEGIIKGYPMARVETHHAYVLFVENPEVFAVLKGLAADISDSREKIVADNQVFYWQVERGESTDTTFSKILAKAKFKSTTTVRNVNTLELM